MSKREQLSAKMMQNMLQEGLYQVFFNGTPPANPSTETSNTNNEELTNVIHHWFETVVNTRLFVTGMSQVLNALVCILTTVSHACVNYGCSLVMVTPVWSSLSYIVAGCLAMEVQRKASNIKVIILIALNVFSLLFGFAALLANSLASVETADLSSHQQGASSNLEKVSYTLFASLCFLGTFYILFLCWRGLRRYSSRNVKAYICISQDPEDTNGLLTE